MKNGELRKWVVGSATADRCQLADVRHCDEVRRSSLLAVGRVVRDVFVVEVVIVFRVVGNSGQPWRKTAITALADNSFKGFHGFRGCQGS
jgi:hypothetical protein